MYVPSRLNRFFPFLAWLGELRDRRVLRADLIAGVTVALVLVPQSMAYAQLAGLPAYYGLYAAFLPPVVAALFGSSRQLATGPVAVVSLLTAAALEPIAAVGSAGYVAYAITLSLLVGLFQLALGLLRLGVAVNFLPHPVVVGFTNAAAIIIATSQLDKIFGVRPDKAVHHYETVWNTILAATRDIHWPTFAIAVGAFTVMIALKRVAPRAPNVLIAVVLTTLISWFIGFERIQTVTLEQIASRAVQEVVRDEIAPKQEIPELSRAVTEAERRYRETLARYGTDDSQTLLAQHAWDTLRLKRERRIKTVRADIEEVKKNRFEYVPGTDGAPGRFYLRGHAPDGAVTDGRLWRVRSIEYERLVMNGGGNVVGSVPRGLPSLTMPRLDLGVMLQLLSATIAISLIGFMEAISIAKAMATRTRQRLDANQELIGQGLGNIVGSFAQSYPTSGSFSRSAVNLDAGAATGFSSVVTGLIVVATLLWLTPLLYHLPQATLAAVIMLAVIGLINVRAIKHAWLANRQDGVVAVVSFVLTLAFAPHLDKGILVGAGLALVLYLYRTMQPRRRAACAPRRRHAARRRGVRSQDLQRDRHDPLRRLAVLRQHLLLRGQDPGARGDQTEPQVHHCRRRRHQPGGCDRRGDAVASHRTPARRRFRGAVHRPQETGHGRVRAHRVVRAPRRRGVLPHRRAGVGLRLEETRRRPRGGLSAQRRVPGRAGEITGPAPPATVIESLPVHPRERIRG